MNDKNAILTFINEGLIVKGFKILAITTNKTTGIFTYRGIKKYFYTIYDKDFKPIDIVIE